MMHVKDGKDPGRGGGGGGHHTSNSNIKYTVFCMIDWEADVLFHPASHAGAHNN